MEVVEQKRSLFTTTSIAIPIELPSVEEALMILVDDLIKAGEAGMDKFEAR